MKRRKLLSGAVAGTLAASALPATAKDLSGMISIIDLDRCNGCPGLKVPRCVEACRVKNHPRFPEPQKPILPYWPQVKFEDYSDKRDVTNRLTPYNWLFVEKVQVQGREVFIPRRCMHCEDASCQKVCPFGTIGKSAEGAVVIDHEYCFGGAKCRDVCPWNIPQRQAGVGLYLDLAPKFAGGGLMYKCDMCADLLAKGDKPACQSACPQGAVRFGAKAQLLKELPQIAQGRYVYGLKENGGTRTIYVSSVAFDDIDQAIGEKYGNKPAMGRPHMHTDFANRLDATQGLAKSVMAAPIIGAGAAVAAALWLKTKRLQTRDE